MVNTNTLAAVLAICGTAATWPLSSVEGSERHKFESMLVLGHTSFSWHRHW
jgi:hypothetical protein